MQKPKGKAQAHSSSEYQKVAELKDAINKLALSTPKPSPSNIELKNILAVRNSLEKHQKWWDSRSKTRLAIYFVSVDAVTENMQSAVDALYSASYLMESCLRKDFPVENVRVCITELSKSLREYKSALKTVLKQFKKI